jgi:hypothetical protein
MNYRPPTRQNYIDCSKLAEAKREAQRTATEGQRAEYNIRKQLRALSYPTSDSTRYENMMLDIDCWFVVPRSSISIKMMNAAVHTGNLCFETQRFNMLKAFDYHETYYSTNDPLYNQLEQESHPKFWEPSWFELGKAEWYIIGVGETIYRVKKCKLHDYIDSAGWLDFKEHLSSKLRLQHFGRKYTDYKVGLLSINDLLHNNIIQKVTRT